MAKKLSNREIGLLFRQMRGKTPLPDGQTLTAAEEGARFIQEVRRAVRGTMLGGALESATVEAVREVLAKRWDKK